MEKKGKSGGRFLAVLAVLCVSFAGRSLAADLRLDPDALRASKNLGAADPAGNLRQDFDGNLRADELFLGITDTFTLKDVEDCFDKYGLDHDYVLEDSPFPVMGFRISDFLWIQDGFYDVWGGYLPEELPQAARQDGQVYLKTVENVSLPPDVEFKIAFSHPAGGTMGYYDPQYDGKMDALIELVSRVNSQEGSGQGTDTGQGSADQAAQAPTVRKLNEEEWEAYWKEHSAADVLGGYVFAGTFVNDLDEGTKILHSLENFAKAAKAMGAGVWDLITGRNSSLSDASADRYLSDTESNKAVLKDIVEERYGNGTDEPMGLMEKDVMFTGDKLTKYLEKEFQEKVEAHHKEIKKGSRRSKRGNWDNLKMYEEFEDTAATVNTVIGSLNSIISAGGEIQELLVDYSDNIRYLENVQDCFPEGSAMSDAIKSLLDQYRNENADTFVSVSFEVLNMANDWYELATKNDMFSYIDPTDPVCQMGEELLDQLRDTHFGTAEKLLELTVGQFPSVSATDKVVDSVYLRADAIQAVRQAEQEMKNGNLSVVQKQEYIDLVDLARDLTIVQYESMLQYYNSAAYHAEDRQKKIEYLESEIQKLRKISAVSDYAVCSRAYYNP